MMLGGCSILQRWSDGTSTTPPPQHAAVVRPQTEPVQARPKPRHIVRETREAREPEKVASIDPKNLIGLEPAAVEHILGIPSNISNNDPSLVWTYSGPGCLFRVFFYPDLKTATFHALKYASTAREQPDNTCIRNILTVKNNGPS